MSRSAYNNTYILGISFISALGGYLFGFDFAVIAGALPFLQRQFGLNEYWAGFATAVLAIGAIIGCLIAGSVSDKYGRKKGLLVAAAIFGLSSLAMAFSPSRGVFIFSRCMAGIGVGMASMLSPMYIAEISPAHLRGRMVATNQLTIVIGILVTNIVNYSLRNVGEDAWRWMFGMGVVPSALFFIGAWWLPESPRWLVRAGRNDLAVAVLERIGGVDFAQSSLADITRTTGGGGKGLGYAAVFQKAVLPAVFIGIGLAVFQQLCGINVVFNYATIIFKSIGVPQDGQLLQTVFIGGVNLLFTLLAMLLVDKVGRKPLMLLGAGGLAILYIVVVRMLAAQSPQVSWFLLAAIGTYAMSLAPVTWVLISEIFPNKVRGAATSIAVVSLWAAYFILTFTFPILYLHLQDHTFYIYAGVCVLGGLFIAARVKETKGKTLEELEEVIIGH
ncbi:MAG: MFS transporter [Sphingobacteriales bacterium 50-39]|nr:sugar porter family MFS transporter [Sphingobacteriales bacterium]OJW54457.1 MAG: MFS transporter [Sphingobacteriales bacterium 50-39]